ncbi:MAG TPA: aspartate 1-decarboxylase [Actinomycetota bacterium]|nr:aspartate 1-decarboxylase [Actinomycetota bacterium]
MIRFLLKSKIHRALVTEARLDYVGSITIDAELMDLADIREHEKVLVVDVDNGSRLETYAIPGPRRSGTICMNGAAARLVHAGDKVIIMTFAGFDQEEVAGHHPRVVFVDDGNHPAGTAGDDSGDSGEGAGGLL